jgi:hypothetical protein
MLGKAADAGCEEKSGEVLVSSMIRAFGSTEPAIALQNVSASSSKASVGMSELPGAL